MCESIVQTYCSFLKTAFEGMKFCGLATYAQETKGFHFESGC